MLYPNHVLFLQNAKHENRKTHKIDHYTDQITKHYFLKSLYFNENVRM